MVRLITDCYDKDGRPIKCWKCGCTEQREVTRGIIDVLDGRGPVCEFEVFCASCNESIGYWAYGYYEPPAKGETK